MKRSIAQEKSPDLSNYFGIESQDIRLDDLDDIGTKKVEESIIPLSSRETLFWETLLWNAIRFPHWISPRMVDKSQVFSYLEHRNLDAFKRVMERHSAEVICMRNDRHQTLLHVAVISSLDYVLTRWLLMLGADPCAQDKDGYTPAHYAVERDDIENLRVLTTIHSSVEHESRQIGVVPYQ
ncbi:unnamed protein product, partial [Didymodactylos carnosus]